jgi:predicted extracellular nuclease
MNKISYKVLCAAIAAVVLLGPSLGNIPTVQAASDSIVISQVYGGGGNSGATYKNDFIELFNRGTSPVDITGWSIQYASVAGSSWLKTDLYGTLIPGQYFLIQEAAGTGGTLDLPPPDDIGNINLGATGGKIALVTNQSTLTCGAGTNDCFPNGLIKDFVGYGTANNYEGSGPVSALSNTTAALRGVGGCTDMDNNASDLTPGDPNPRNGGSPITPCADSAPTVAGLFPENGATGVQRAVNLIVTFSENVNLSGTWYSLACSSSGTKTSVVTGGPLIYTLNPDADFAYGETCIFTVYAFQVTDQDTNDPPDNMETDYVATFTVENTCSDTYTHIYEIQGSGEFAMITGVVTTQGVVIADEEGASPALRGFYIQDLTGDGDTATSDGIFVFNNSSADTVALGDIVQVTGTAGEYQNQTQISSVTELYQCGTGSVSPTDLNLPFASAADPEKYEGMLVRLPQILYVTDTYYLGRFGQVTLSGNSRLFQPTNIALPGAPALAIQAANNLNQIIVDDPLNNQNPDPILFARGGNPLSASNTLRGGDAVTSLVGVITYTWSGNSASGNAYRVRPVNAMGGGIPDFQPANVRPASPINIGGDIKVVGMNLYNYFNTFGTGNCTNGVGGTTTDCRGADTQSEFDRQWPKTVAAIIGTGADIIGITEMENDGYESASAIQDLVNKLNSAIAPGTYAFINADALTGQTNALGMDAIKVGLLYKPANITPVGATAVLNTTAFVNGGDASPHNRPSLLQAFQTGSGARFIVDVNHLKSKGSACDTPDAGDGQGNCNIVRTNAANALLTWLGTNPTGTSDPDILILGDLNSYAKEDPITALKTGGYTDLIEQFSGQSAYSYLFDGQWGYLDHALASASLVSQVSSITEWHINADEPVVLDYTMDYKSTGQLTSLYNADQFRAADHDPIIIGLNLATPIPPDTDITSGPPSITTSKTASFSFTSPDTAAVFECSLDGASFTTCSSPHVYSGLTAGAHNFSVRAVNPPGSPDPTPASRSWTIKTIPVFYSTASQDGWILESTETSNVGGTMNATAATLSLGDNNQKKQYRSILSFKTSSLPDDATITKVTLKLKHSSVTPAGTNPITLLQGIYVDLRNGFFGTSSALQLTDFNAPVSKTVGPFKPVLTAGWYTISLNSSTFASINKLATNGGLTQIRLRFKLDDNNNTIANMLNLISGNNATAANRPTLLIEYYVP